jgi:hypothetical protein
VVKKIGLGIAGLLFTLVVGVEIGAGNAYAAKKVDCDKVMSEVNSGKKTSIVAKDLSISTSSVYRCKKKAAAAKSVAMKGAPASSSKASPTASASPSKH